MFVIVTAMALQRFEKLSPDRKQRLLGIAAEEFAARGYDRAALGVIAKKSGMGKASVYYYFADKADLYATVLAEAWKKLSTGGKVDLKTLTAETFWPEFETVTLKNLELCDREPWLLAVSKLLNRAIPNPTGKGVIGEYVEKRRAWEAAFIGRGQELGVVRKDVPPELLVTISLGANHASNLWLLEHREELGPKKSNHLAIQVFKIYCSILSPTHAGIAY
jgi:AcrR family transcriptional regulator